MYASHAYGYNRSTATIESEAIGYRTYGGFFFDVQAHRSGQQGLFNSMLGYARTTAPTAEGRDIVHYGQTLGLGGIFLRAGDAIFFPAFNTPDYVHRSKQKDEPIYRVLADGPLRAIVEASAAHWGLGKDEVALRATYEMRAGEEYIRAHVRISPTRVSGAYSMGTGVVVLPKGRAQDTERSISVAGTQEARIGELALGIAFHRDIAHSAPNLQTPDGINRVIQFRQLLTRGKMFQAEYTLAAAWSGWGFADPLRHLQRVLDRSLTTMEISPVKHERNPRPEALDGEPN